MVWIEEHSVITLEELERLKKTLNEISLITMFSIKEITEVLKQGLFNPIKLEDDRKRLESFHDEIKYIKGYNKKEKSYSRFLNKPIGRRKRK